MIVCDSITAVLLFAQFSILRSRAILAIASGYLFVAVLLAFWFLAFPGVFGPATWWAACRAACGCTPHGV